MLFSSHEPMVVSFTNTMRLRKSSISGQTILWKQRSLRRCRSHRSGRVKALPDERRLCVRRSNSRIFYKDKATIVLYTPSLHDAFRSHAFLLGWSFLGVSFM